MLLEPGQTIIHPFHGPAKVTRHVTRTLRGCPTEYAELYIEGVRPLTIAVPVANADEIGLREIAGMSEFEVITELVVTGKRDCIAQSHAA